MIKNKKHINPSDYIKKYRRGGLVPLFQYGHEVDPYGGLGPNLQPPPLDLGSDSDSDGIPNSVDKNNEWIWNPNNTYDLTNTDSEILNTLKNNSENNSDENITNDGVILDEGELQCQMCDGGFPINVAPVNGACPEGSIPDDGKTNPCDAEKTEDAEEQTEGSQDTQITKTERGAPGWHTPDPYDIGPYGESGDLFHLMGTIHGMGTDLGLWNPGFRGEDETTTTTTPGATEEQIEEQKETQEEVVCQKCDEGYPVNIASVDGKCPEGSVPDDGTNPCTGEKKDTEENVNNKNESDNNNKKNNPNDNILNEDESALTPAENISQYNQEMEDLWNDPQGDSMFWTDEMRQRHRDRHFNEDGTPKTQEEKDAEAAIRLEESRKGMYQDPEDGQWYSNHPAMYDENDKLLPQYQYEGWDDLSEQMYGGSIPYFQGGGTIDEAEYEQDQRQKQAANMPDTLDLQGPNTNYLASMNANPNATNQPFIGPKLPNLDPDGDGINTGIDATPDGTDPNFIGPQPQPTPDLDPDNDQLNIGVDATPFGDDGPNFNPQDNEPSDKEGDIACQKCEGGYPMNVAPVDGQCPEGTTPDDGSDPCAGQPAPKDEETEETTEEETTEEKKEKGEKQPFKPFRAAIKAAEFVNAWSRKRADRKKKRQAMLETSSDYVFGDSATDATNKGQYDVNTGRMQPDKQVYARQGKYGIELPKAGYGWGDLWNDVKGAGKFVSNMSPAGLAMNTYVDTKADYDAGNIKSTDDLWSRGANNLLDNSQQALQGAGFVPGYGAAADLVNAGISKTRAHYEDDPIKKAQYNIDASTNLVSAVPFAGDAVAAGATLDMVTGSNVRNQLAQDYVDSTNKSTPVPTESPSITQANIKSTDEYVPQSQRTGRYGKELPRASAGLEWLKNNYPGFDDLTTDQQQQVLSQYSTNSQSQNTSGFSQQYLDTQKYKDEQRTLGYDPVINDLPSWLRKTKEGFGRVIIDDEMERRMRGQLAGGKLDPQVAEEYARFLGSYRGPAAIDYNLEDYNRFQGFDADKQSRFNYPGVAFGYKDDLPGRGPWDTVSGDYSPNTLSAWMQLADQVNQPKKYKDLDEDAIEAKNKKQFNRELNIESRKIEDSFLDDDYDMSLAYIPEDIEEEEDPFGPEGFANVDQELMNRLNATNEEIVSLPAKTINQIPTVSNNQLPARSTSVVQQEIPAQKNTESAYDFSGENPYEYGTDEYYNWKKAKRSAMFANQETKKKPTKKENKRAEMFADAYVPQSQRAYGGEELDLDAKTISKLIALGADIEIL